MRRRAALFLSPALLLALRRPSLAQAPWTPDRPVRLVISFAAGGSFDIVGRIIAEGIGSRLGQTIVVEQSGRCRRHPGQRGGGAGPRGRLHHPCWAAAAAS